MGTSGRDRRFRSRIGKRRTPGQRAEDSDEEQHGSPVVVEDTDDNLQGEPACGSAGPAGEVDANGGEEVEYTRRQQVSPTRKRGRLPVPGRTKLKGRTSLAEILAASPVEIAQILIKNGFCTSTRNCLAQVLGSCTARIKFGLVEAFGLPHYSEGSRWRRAHFCGRNVVRSTFAL